MKIFIPIDNYFPKVMLGFFLVVMAPALLIGQWSADRKLSTNEGSAGTNENMGQCLAVHGDTVHVVWWDSNNNGSGIYYKHSFDAGLTWSVDFQLTPSSGACDFPSISVSGAVVHVAFRDTANGQKVSRYMRSTDAGNSWDASVSLGDYYWWPSIAASGNAVFMALNANDPGNSEVYCRGSLDNGVHWDSTMQISNATNRSEDPSITASGSCIHFAWNDKRSGTMEIYYRRSTDFGATWGPEIQMSKNNGGITYAPMVSANGPDVDLVWIGSPNIVHVHSTDYGATWAPCDSLARNVNALYPSIVRNDGHANLVCFNTNTGVFYQHSDDGGATWDSGTNLVGGASKPARAFVGVGGPVVHVIWTDQRDGHAAVYYKRNPMGNARTTAVTPGESNQYSSGISLSAGPNPFNGITTITFTTNEDRRVTLAVYDRLGREVERLMDGEQISAGLYHCAFDGTTFPAGVYYCRLTNGSQMGTKALVLMK